jgi:hypothetical protein
MENNDVQIDNNKSSLLYNKILENKNDFWDDVQNIKK